MRSAHDILMGGGGKSVSFATIGTYVTGEIMVEPESRQQVDLSTDQPKFFKDGNPQMQVVITLSTDAHDPTDPDDDGVRRLFVKGGMMKAIREAVRAAGRKRLEVGGRLTVTYAGDGVASKPGFNPPKIYSAVYVPPAGSQAAPITVPAATASQVYNTPIAKPAAVTQTDWDAMDRQQRERVASAFGA